MHSVYLVLKIFKDAFFPTGCPVCRCKTPKSGICDGCYKALETAFLEDNDFTLEYDGKAVRCRSVFSYEYEQVKALVAFIKENTDTDVFMYISSLVAKEIYNLSISGDVVVTYVPRSNEGIVKNGFDQSELLARNVSKIIPRARFKRLIKRVGKAKPQKRLDKKGREENLKGKLRGIKVDFNPENIVIIDDVFTTGSSLKESIKAVSFVYPNAKIYCVTASKNVLI